MNFFPSKKEVIELDEQMRTYEQEMKHLTGDALEQKMNQYTNATHRFEQLNGFAYKSEITGILKRTWLFLKKISQKRSTLYLEVKELVLLLVSYCLKILIFCFLTNQQTTWMLIP